jgi:putative ABC transport system permease protein
MVCIYLIDEYSFDTFHNHYKDIHRVTLTIEGGEVNNYTSGNSSIHIGPTVHENFPEVINYTRITNDQKEYFININGEKITTKPLYADSSFFNVFTFPIIKSASNELLKNPNEVVLSSSMALKLFQSKNILGKSLDIVIRDSIRSFQIVAVVEDCPTNSSIQYDLLLPMQFYQDQLARKYFDWINP